MDPATMIVSALVAGAAAAAKDTASAVVKDAYAALKELIVRRFKDRPEAQMALEQHQRKPQVWQAPLKDALVETAADKDEAILKQAHQLLQLVQPQQVGTGKYTVQIAQARGVVIGDEAHVEQHFGDESG